MPKRAEVFRNVLILATLIGLVLFSWLVGHILRYSIPALWHPPIQETDPQTEYGIDLEFEGIRRLVVLPEMAPGNAQIQIYKREVQITLPGRCLGYTYYTSLPAKCRTVDGRLVQVGGVEGNFILIPQDK